MSTVLQNDYLLSAEHINIAACITAHWNSTKTPRVDLEDLVSFLKKLEYIAKNSKDYIVSKNEIWAKEIYETTAQLLSKIMRAKQSNALGAIIDSDTTEQVISILRTLFDKYELYGFAIGQTTENTSLDRLISKVADRIPALGLIFMIDLKFDKSYQFFDPFPQTTELLSHGSDPGVLFWSKKGNLAFLPIDSSEEFLERFINKIDERTYLRSSGVQLSVDGNFLENLISHYRVKNAPKQKKLIKLLHLSDLHYGREEASRNESFLLSHIENDLMASTDSNGYSAIDQVVITGDLSDNPKSHNRNLFENFRGRLIRIIGNEPIIIPGNHDSKWLGNIPSDMSELAKLRWSNIVINDKIRSVFLCFDSSIDARFLARGKVTKAQMMEVASNYENYRILKPEITDYFHIALVHHHPFSFETPPKTLIQRGLSLLGQSDEVAMFMEDADEFVQWCATRKIPLILHGHKHVQRHMRRVLPSSNGRENRAVTAVGCGASLGAEQYPLSYNIVSIDWDTPQNRRWSVTYYSSTDAGGGFEKQFIEVDVSPKQ